MTFPRPQIIPPKKKKPISISERPPLTFDPPPDIVVETEVETDEGE